MRTMATTALLLGFFLVGAVPAAQADHDERGSFRSVNTHRTAFPNRGGAFRDDAREVRALAFELERATDELVRDARRAAGRIDRRDAAALRAIRGLEVAADEFRREVARGRVFDRDAQRDFAQLQRSYRQASHRVDAFGFARELRHDLRRVERLIVALDRALDERHGRVAWQAGHPARVAWR